MRIRNMLTYSLWPCACVALGLMAGVSVVAKAESPHLPHQERLRVIYKELVEINTTNSSGNCTEAVDSMIGHLKSAGFEDRDISRVIPEGAPKKGNLVVRYRGTGVKKPVLLLAHIDVVEAKREDWKRDPFRLVEENGYFYARGAFDDKAMAAILVSNFIRYRQEAFVPQRDLILALTCDEELISLYNGVEYLLRNHRDLIDAEYVVNEGAPGLLDQDGKHVRMAIQAGEKGVLHFLLEVTNPGGHSSLPNQENAINRLASALVRISTHRFPINLSDTTRKYFEKMATISSPDVASDMREVLRPNPDPAALERLSRDPFNNATLRTTCVATMLQAGHAMNALPQKATAHVNCRVLPNDDLEQVERQFRAVVNDDKVTVSRAFEPTVSPIYPISAELLSATEAVTQEIWPGVPVVPTLFVAATDGRFLNSAGIPTFGVMGLFRDPDGSGVHGLNERIRVNSLYEGHEFLYRLGKRIGAAMK